jgi:PPK2 family polyphosphate:nucleotide phosphotransferase
MKIDAELMRSLSRQYRVTKGKSFTLSKWDPKDTGPLDGTHKEQTKKAMRDSVARMAELQGRLYAQDTWALLLIFQSMDAGGKDGAIKHVMSGVNPQGCQVASFKSPSPEELDHDFLWRCQKHIPERGRIGIFNRSYYEEVLVVRVHPEFLARERLPAQVVDKHLWRNRHEDIATYERYLARNGVAVRKFFLNVSRAEQKRRFLERLDEPEKNWKFSASDVAERAHWDAYMEAYEESIRRTASAQAPWYVVPADNKWFTRAVVAGAVIDALEDLGLEYPKLDESKRKALAKIGKALRAGKFG